jgi:hypothetical protein
MVDILYFAGNIRQCNSFTQWIMEELHKRDCFYTYDKKFQIIQTEYATLYIRTYYSNFIGILPRINYHLFKINFDEFSVEQLEKIYGIIKTEIKPKYAMNVQPLTFETDILCILTKGADEYEQKRFIKTIVKGESYEH